MSEVAPVVFIVDDDASFLNATARLLRASGLATQTFLSPQAFLEALTDDTAGCAVVDLHMPGLNGLAVQDALMQAGRALPVVFLTGEGDIPTSVRAMRHGAEDFLEKRAPKERLLDAIQRALARGARERAERQRSRDARRRLALLTDREREVLGHVVRGRLNKQIAADLGIHERTVKLHRTAITTKLGVPSAAELVQLSHAAGLFVNGAPTFP